MRVDAYAVVLTAAIPVNQCVPPALARRLVYERWFHERAIQRLLDLDVGMVSSRV